VRPTTTPNNEPYNRPKNQYPIHSVNFVQQWVNLMANNVNPQHKTAFFLANLKPCSFTSSNIEEASTITSSQSGRFAGISYIAFRPELLNTETLMTEWQKMSTKITETTFELV
jgi:hypothetical protein